MRRIICGIAVAMLMAGCVASADVTLATDGTSEYVIALTDDPIPAETTAAQELADHLQMVTGHTFEVKSAAEVPEDAKQILVGPGARFAKLCPDIKPEDLKHDGTVIRTVGDTLVLSGDRPRGTLYAVYHFLENWVGCRWWTETESEIPSKPTLQIRETDQVYVPKLQCREAFYRGAFPPTFAPKLKLNGHFERIPESHGGHYEIIGWCHTFERLLPPEKYFDAHPEWYSEINGNRVKEHSQLCLTNEAMTAEFIRNALVWVRDKPEAGIISISQNDWHGRCECEPCKALEESEGAASGPLLHFVNKVADAIGEEFPDFLVETLAYSYTRQAPKNVRPRDNVVIRLCSIECSYSQTLAEGPQNETFRRDIEAWSAIANKLYIWNYVTNFRNYLLPHPNHRVLAPNIRYFVDHNAIALFEQGDSSSSCSDFPELRAWMLAQLMWDEGLHPEWLRNVFLKGYYGPAADLLEQYINLICDAVEESGTYLRCYMEDTAGWLTLEDHIRATRLFEQAEARVADDPVLLARVRRARMPLQSSWLVRHRELKSTLRNDAEGLFGFHEPGEFLEDFLAAAKEFDCRAYREGGGFANYEMLLQGRFRAPGPPPEACKGLPEDTWADVQDNDFSLHGLDRWVTLVEDAAASDGHAARMTTNHTQWATQFPVGADLVKLGKVRCFAEVRCQAAAGATGPAMDVGIYDNATKRGLFAAEKTIEEVGSDAYVVVDLGIRELTADMYFWFAPKNNPDDVQAIFVDRIYCIRDDVVEE